ncbi:MAG: hypothetical protein ACWGMZ_06460 [Thermoguttaceae bacterium]
MAISKELHDWIKGMTPELRQELWGPKGYPAWGTKFVEIEQQTGEVGDAIACALLSDGLHQQAEAEGHPAGKCGGCGEPIPFDELAVRLLQARCGEVAWQESFGRCKRCRKSFFPSVPSLGNRAG